jgi:hypothetical protein
LLLLLVAVAVLSRGKTFAGVVDLCEAESDMAREEKGEEEREEGFPSLREEIHIKKTKLKKRTRKEK